jgi:hypothetical protein
MFFDGSKSDDATAWWAAASPTATSSPSGSGRSRRARAGKTWLAPRGAVDKRVDEVFERFNVVAFWGDPSHAKDDEDSTRYWDGLFDKWMRKYKDRLDPKHWPVKSGLGKHAIMFDMTGPSAEGLRRRGREFVEEIENLNDIEEFEPTVPDRRPPGPGPHMKNAGSCRTSSRKRKMTTRARSGTRGLVP